MSVDLRLGDCLEVLRTIPESSVDALVTDPPYGLSFMGKHWDYDVPSLDIWAECLRVLKPGGHLLAFAGTRTQHRMAVRIEDAGFDIRDMIAWVYGSGFPKSHDVAKAVHSQTLLGGSSTKQRRQAYMGDSYTPGETVGTLGTQRSMDRLRCDSIPNESLDLCADARRWDGWGTALKPAMEPITVARKPLCGTVAENVLAHGVGALNIDGCCVGTEGGCRGATMGDKGESRVFNNRLNGDFAQAVPGLGRWPANLIHDGSEEASRAFGDATRFFYCAKAGRRDREEGLDGFAVRNSGVYEMRNSGNDQMGPDTFGRNHHPTVKPTELMRYLCRLVTPPGGLVLDPFMGSGSTGKAAVLEGFRFLGIERDEEYFAIAKTRIEYALRNLIGTGRDHGQRDLFSE